MKVEIKELYERGEETDLPPDTPVASVVITNDANEYLYEFFITKVDYGALKDRQREYKEAEKKKVKHDEREALLVRYLAELEHERWCKWTQEVAKKECISDERRQRWESFWIPYGLLSDETKETDEIQARRTLRTVRDNEAFWVKKDEKDKHNQEVATDFMKGFKATNFVIASRIMGQ